MCCSCKLLLCNFPEVGLGYLGRAGKEWRSSGSLRCCYKDLGPQGP